ncbi:hypothetical protein [Alienimonas chondri]|uniref:Uncharacterized protein n=1 Tax=Alienimonas chondri TaxID=2681879 RepID=A0ABX1VED4_9PLAN|nr:hypothetical protein [Alienimonas chondri]NNJ26250.1 hypothetical protein [Alienimonas chondri]
MARSSIPAALVGWLSLTVAATGAHAAPLDTSQSKATVQDQCTALAAKVAQVADGKSVQIGQFAPVGLSGANFGPGLEESLRTALKAAKATVVADNAVYEVKGSYAFAKSREPQFAGRKVVKVKAEVIELEFAEAIAEIPLRIDATDEVAEVIGISGEIADAGAGSSNREETPAEKTERRAELEELDENPTTVVLDGTRVAPSKDSEVQVEVLAGPAIGELRPRPITLIDGKAFVDLKTGEVCQLRVHNKSQGEIAVKASLDGLNSFHFADKAHRDADGKLTVGPHYIFESGQTSEIPGWFLRMEGPNNYQAFSVVEYGAGAASSQGREASGRIGVLHLQVSDALLPLTPTKGGTKGFGDQEIGRGEEFTVEQKSVNREVLAPFAFITIRYNRE